ncbi:MAG: ATP-binding protein [Gammaproteobacteria bacterium]
MPRELSVTEDAGPPSASVADDALRLSVARARATLYLQQRFTLWAGNLGLQLACVLMMAPFRPPAALAAWLLANLSLLLLRARATSRLRHGELVEASAIEAWFAQLVRYLFAAGLVWGVGAFTLLPALHEPHALVCLLTLMGVCWGAAVSLSMVFPAAVAFVVPVTLLTGARIAMSSSDTRGLLLVLTVAFAIFVLATARNYARTVDDTLRLSGENLALLAEVTASRDAAERSSAEKSRFVAAVSHDLRQPLHAARLAVESLGAEAAHEPPALTVAVLALRALEAQFDALLDASALEAGVLQPRYSEVALAPLFGELEREFLGEARQRGIGLDIASTGLTLHTDPRCLRRILRNLLDNAIKYSERGVVSLSIEPDANDIVIAVSDNGPGIAPDWVARVFEPYLRLPDTGHAPGHGLGLAIVRQLADLLQAPIAVWSEPGVGSRFTLRLPRDARAASQAGPQPRFLGNLHVLLVEDDAPARAALVALLTAWGCHASAAPTLDAALDLAAGVARPVDVIVSDFQLGHREDGIAVIARARVRLDPLLPAVLISGETGDELAARAASLGLPLLHKPLAAATLRATLTAVTEA